MWLSSLRYYTFNFYFRFSSVYTFYPYETTWFENSRIKGNLKRILEGIVEGIVVT